MDIEHLKREWLGHAGLDSTMEFFLELEEKERRKFAGQAKEQWTFINRAHRDWDGDVFKALTGDSQFQARWPILALADLIVMSTSNSKSLIGRLRHFYLREDDVRQYAVKILETRQPDWIETLIENLLSRDNMGWGTSEADIWPFIAELRTANLARQADQGLLSQALLAHVDRGRWQWDPEKNPENYVVEFFTANPAALESELLPLLQDEATCAALNSATVTWRTPKINPWLEAYIQLVAASKLDRMALVDTALDALNADFEQRATRFPLQLLQRLELTDEELIERVGLILNLTGHLYGPIVKQAFKWSRRLIKLKQVTDDDVILFAAATQHESKGIAQQAIRMVKGLASKNIGRQDGILLLLDALGHPAPDIQLGAISQLKALKVETDQAFRLELEDAYPYVSVAAQQELTAWLGLSTAETSAVVVDSGAFQARIAVLPDTVLADVGLGGAISTPNINLQPFNLPKLGKYFNLESFDAVQPAETIEELIQICLRYLADSRDPILREQILDGIARHGATPLTAAQQKLVKPLLKQAKRRSEWAELDDRPVAGDFAAVILAWLEGTQPKPLLKWQVKQGLTFATQSRSLFTRLRAALPIARKGPLSVSNWMQNRLRYVASFAAHKQSHQLLALPTHQPYWIDPLVFAERLAESDLVVPEDFGLALARLAPCNQKAAIEALQQIDNEYARIAQYALGAKMVDLGTSELWQLAKDLRKPVKTRFNLKWKRMGNRYGADVLNAQFKRSTTPPQGRTFNLMHLMQRAPGFTGHGWWTDWVAYDPDRLRWYLTTIPTRTDVSTLTGLEMVLTAGGSEELTAAAMYLEPFLNPDTPIGREAWLLLATACGVPKQSLNAFAADVLIQAITDGRFDPTQLGAAFRELFPTDAPKKELTTSPDMSLKRVKEALQTVAAVSDLHADAIRQLIDAVYVSKLVQKNSQNHHLRGLLYDLTQQLGVGVQMPETRAYFASVPKNSSKGSKQAKAILAAPETSEALQTKLNGQILENRLQRAERWVE